MPRSAAGVRVSVSVALLLAGLGSVTPPGAAMAAVLLMLPAAAREAVVFTVKVAVPVASRLTMALMFPVPLAGQVDPAEAVQVQVTLVRSAGKVSVTAAPITGLGPALPATMV